MKLDDLDKKLLEILSVDARISNREVAKKINVSDVTIGKRLSRLQKAGLIRLAAITDPRAANLNCSALIRLEVKPSLAREVSNIAALRDDVFFVALTAGRHNVVILALVEDRDALAELVYSQLRPLNGVQSVETGEVWRSFKHRIDIARISANLR